MSSNERMWCYQCEAAVTPDAGQSTCPECRSDFLEELDNDQIAPEEYLRDINAPAEPASGGMQDAVPLLQLLAAVVQMQTPNADPAASSASGGAPPDRSGGALLDQMLRAIMTTDEGGAGPGGNPFQPQMAGNAGDYAEEDAIEQLMAQLFQQGDGDQGPPPATEAVMASIPVVKCTVADAGEPCPVCKEGIELNAPIRRLPCTHFFCVGCIGPWLSLHATCPVCRFSMVEEDAEMEEASEGASANRTGV